jgi:hypothetical protein
MGASVLARAAAPGRGLAWISDQLVRPLHQRRAGGTMKNRIAIWASVGFLVAGFWALYFFAAFPSTNERLRDMRILVDLTCPVAMAGWHYPISVYETLVANAVTYALIGLILETLRPQLSPSK